MNEENYDKAYYAEEIKLLADEIEKGKDSSIVFKCEKCDNIPVCATKLGGFPDLPAFVDYPVRSGYTTKNGEEISPEKAAFVCQINCAELAPFITWESKIPKSGMLYIFWTGEDPDFYKKEYGVNTLLAYYWGGETSELVRREADKNTKLRAEFKVTFEEFEECTADNINDRIEELLGELEQECNDAGIDHYFTEEYDLLDAMREKCVISDSTKLFGYKAGYGMKGEYNSFLQLNEHSGALWYAFFNVNFDEISQNSYDNIKSQVENKPSVLSKVKRLFGGEARDMKSPKTSNWIELHSSVSYDAD